jgi:hypothetical protein
MYIFDETPFREKQLRCFSRLQPGELIHLGTVHVNNAR